MNRKQDAAGIAAHRRTFLVICVCFLLSGFAALLYETVWLRQFAIILGTSEQALAVILSSYMGGLSFGAWIASRWVKAIARPLLTYGLLEFGIAVFAVAMPLGLAAVARLQIQIFGGRDEPPPADSTAIIFFGLISSFALIMPPTAMMGATLPLLAKHVVRNDRELGPRIGLLYGVNTLGAVAGTLCAAFVLMPTLGLGRTTWVGAALNLAVFVIVWLGMNTASVNQGAQEVSPRSRKRSKKLAAVSSSAKGGQPLSDEQSIAPPYQLILGFAAVAGAISFSYEIIFTRMLGHILGGSIFAFATMLAGFLLGIALGGGIASRLATNRRTTATGFAYAQALTGIFALIAYWTIDRIAGGWFAVAGEHHWIRGQIVVAILILVPSATCIGTTVPFAIRVFAKDESEASRGAAKVYLWNTVGAITGALLTGIFILPALAYHGATILAVGLNAFLALLVIWVMKLPRIHVAAGIMTVGCLLLLIPTTPEQVLRASVMPGPGATGEFIFNRVGRSGTVSVLYQSGHLRFQTNGLPEAKVPLRGAIAPHTLEAAWLSVLPTLVRPECKSMLIVGLGGGTAVSFVPPSIERVDVFELEPAVLEANYRVGEVRRRDPLADERVRIVLNDGRNGLTLTDKKYDAIVSQPSHPWTAGASHLYTIEYNEIVRRHLNPGGVFLQWMDANFVDVSLLRSMAAGLKHVFPHVRLYEPTRNGLMFVASDQPIQPESVPPPLFSTADPNASMFREFGIVTPTDLLSLLRMDEAAVDEFCRNAPLITDEHNLLAFRSPSLLRERPSNDSLAEQLLAWQPISYAPDRLRELCPSVEYRVLFLRNKTRLASDAAAASSIDNEVEQALVNATLAQFRGDVVTWKRELERAAAIDPSDPRPAFVLLSYAHVGMFPQLSEPMRAKLLDRLDDRHRGVFEAIQASTRQDYAAIRAREGELASFLPNDIGYALAARMRLLWRYNDKSAHAVRSAEESLVIAREAAPSLGTEIFAYFQTVAAVEANQPYVALSTVTTLADSITTRAEAARGNGASMDQVRSLFPLLQNCRQVIAQPAVERSISPDRYRRDLSRIDQVLRGYRR